MSSLFYTTPNCLLRTSRGFFFILLSLFVLIQIVLFERNFQNIVESRCLRTVPLFIFGCIKMLITSEPELFLVEVDMRSTTASKLLPVGYFPEKEL